MEEITKTETIETPEKVVTKQVTETPESVSTEKVVVEKKKGNGCLTGCLVTLGILILLAVILTVAGYLGYKKVVSMADPVDLGVTYTQQDFVDAMDNANFVIDDYSKLCLDCEYPTFSNPQQLEVNITGAQASAWVDIVNENLTYGSIENTQISFTDDKVEVSTLFTYQGKTIPVYMSGNVFNTSSTTVGGNIDTIKAGGIKVPANIVNYVETGLTTLANNKLSTLGDTLQIDTLEIKNNTLHFEGLFPTEAK